MSEPQNRTERATAQVEHRNGACVSGSCKCEAFELMGKKDGFLTCVCGHTKWAHASTWVSGRDTVTP